jgi:hypothetical protein
MKRTCRLFFLASLAITLAVIFIAGCSSAKEANSKAKRPKADRTSIAETTNRLGKIA